ncbi:hypothetical protein CPB85DRAFT_1386587 [Mucidula mucida]|nr:hypothetical protein CPB85DRAFT_1386587 [Mucidula mucida]
MDSHIDDHHQKDYMSSFFPSVDLDHLQNDSDMGIMQQTAHNTQHNQTMMHGLGMPPQLDMEMLGSLMSMQGIDSPQHPLSGASPSQTHFPPNSNANNPQMIIEQYKLAQLQQLQQLQNQIFQQQMALISGQPANNDTPLTEPVRERHATFHGLPTPGSSTELRAQHQPLEYVSPMVLNYLDPPTADNYGEAMTPMPHSMNPQYPVPPRGATSAPAHIVFRSNSSADIDVDISPLTSPWLGAQQNQHSYIQRNKRTASSSGDESTSKPSKKKQSPAIRPYNPSPAPKRSTRHSKSTTSTPLLRSARSRNGSIVGNEVVDDSPSPVDLSMPPPASTSGQAILPASSTASSNVPSPSLTPVTPASIMNLGRLGVNNTNNLAPCVTQDKGKSSATSGAPQRSKAARRTSGGASSSTLKAILPAGSAPSRSNTGAQPVVQVRKTSHKAAEQKRRDSLKTTFDELRGLLPPIPLPSDGRTHDEPVLPGALPPRGPPKAGSDGPNKAVSKLQLLMCGNEFIRQLKGRVERRDEEITKLRNEIGRLRGAIVTTAPRILEEGEPLDLEKDLDEIESLTLGFGRGTMLDEDADEEGDADD